MQKTDPKEHKVSTGFVYFHWLEDMSLFSVSSFYLEKVTCYVPLVPSDKRYTSQCVITEHFIGKH